MTAPAKSNDLRFHPFEKMAHDTQNFVLPAAYTKKSKSNKKLSLKEIQSWRADKARLEPTQWVVTEKVHGANFCLFTTDGKQCLAAKRTGPMKESDAFFGSVRFACPRAPAKQN